MPAGLSAYLDSSNFSRAHWTTFRTQKKKTEWESKIQKGKNSIHNSKNNEFQTAVDNYRLLSALALFQDDFKSPFRSSYPHLTITDKCMTTIYRMLRDYAERVFLSACSPAPHLSKGCRGGVCTAPDVLEQSGHQTERQTEGSNRCSAAHIKAPARYCRIMRDLYQPSHSHQKHLCKINKKEI